MAEKSITPQCLLTVGYCLLRIIFEAPPISLKSLSDIASLGGGLTCRWTCSSSPSNAIKENTSWQENVSKTILISVKFLFRVKTRQVHLLRLFCRHSRYAIPRCYLCSRKSMKPINQRLWPDFTIKPVSTETGYDFFSI